MVMSVSSSESMCYEIRIQGELDEQWADWLKVTTISSKRVEDDIPITVLAIRVPDQAKLRGILNKIWDLNLTLISVIYIEEFLG